MERLQQQAPQSATKVFLLVGIRQAGRNRMLYRDKPGMISDFVGGSPVVEETYSIEGWRDIRPAELLVYLWGW